MGVKSENWFIGWDYAHCGDYCGYEEYMPESIITYGKKWTTEEIIEECKNAIDQIIDFESKKILEEPKKIEKLEPVRGSDLSDLTDKAMVLRNNALIKLCKTLNNINSKVNELIDKINNLKEK